MLTPREDIPSTGKAFLRGGSNPQRCIRQDREPNTLPAELFRPPDGPLKGCRWVCMETDRCYRTTDGLAGPYLRPDRLVGLVVKASASRAEDPGFESRLSRDF